ncbi:MAG: peptidylprolyl isomerase [Chloroflexota bacterium]
MTFRAKPIVKRSRRPSWESQDRRSLLLNVGFGLVVVAAVAILVIAAGVVWYGDHLASVGSVNGASISKDEFRDRLGIESWRLDEAERRIRTEKASGRMTDEEEASNLNAVSQQRDQIQGIVLERLIDNKLQASLAGQEGVSVSPGDIDARLKTEATNKATRHAWMIAVEPAVDENKTEPTDAQKAAAKAKADAALADLKAGKKWEDVAKTASNDSSTAAQGGDLRWIVADDPSLDPKFLAAVFAANQDEPTPVVEGDDGIFRIGRATEIVPETVDATYQTRIVNDGLDLAKYRQAVQGDVIRKKLEDKLVGDLTKEGPQRRVSEIYIGAPDAPPPAGALKVRHILYSPKDDPSAAQTLDKADPAWAAAEKEARATYDRVKADPSLFDSIARTESDEEPARGVTGSGGKLPYYGPNDSLDPAFLAAIMKPGLTPGQLLEPVRSAFGWHVIQVMYPPTDLDHLKGIKTQVDGGADFNALARDNSDVTGKDGTPHPIDLGWIAHGQLDPKFETPIFAAKVPGTTDVIEVADDGIYLFKVWEEQTRTPAGAQLDTIRQSAFSRWYTEKKTAAQITRSGTDASPAESPDVTQ